MSSYAIVKDPAGTLFGYRPGRPYIEDEHGEHHLLTHEKFGFWHPGLPEVLETGHYETSQDVHTKTIVQPGIGATAPVWGHFPRALSTFVLLLCLASPALAQNQPCKVNVATATPAELAYLIQTGPVLAGRISEAKPADLAALDAVKGVGVKWLEYNREHVAFAGETTCTAKLTKPTMPEGGTDGPATGETESDTVRRDQDGAQ